MSSATRYESDAARKVQSTAAGRVMGRIERLGMSPRQQELNRYYTWYRTDQYEVCKLDWDGLERPSQIETEAIATAGFLPPGFYDAGATMPLKFRKPTAPYHLVKTVVDRFTGLLFSERRHPVFNVEGDEETEYYANEIAKAARLWPSMILARTYGGAMGTVALGFQFVEGRPLVEVHDPRWLFPEFADRWEMKLSKLEKRYMYPIEERDPETGAWIEVWYWYRRIIDATSDVVFEPTPVGTGEEPDWVERARVDHNLGYCPVVWVQNLPIQDSLDGDPDCQGIYDTVQAIDALQAQGIRGLLKNNDPTVIVMTDGKLGELRKGSDNAVKLEKGGDAKYLELTGSSIKSTFDTSAILRAQALEVAQCVLEHPDVATQTATEVVRRYESMFSKADVLREQYGEKGIKPLMTMMLEAVRKLGRPLADEAGSLVRRAVSLPPKVVDGRLVPLKLPEQQLAPVEMKWPPYLAPSPQEAEAAARAASTAKAANLIDQKHASGYVAPHFAVEDVDAMVGEIEREKKQETQALEQQMLADMQRAGGGGGNF